MENEFDTTLELKDPPLREKFLLSASTAGLITSVLERLQWSVVEEETLNWLEQERANARDNLSVIAGNALGKTGFAWTYEVEGTKREVVEMDFLPRVTLKYGTRVAHIDPAAN